MNAIGYKVTRHSKIIYQEELELLKFIDKNSKRVRSSPELHTSNSESTKKLKADETKLPSISIESKNAIEVLQNIKYFRPCDDICKSEIDVDFDVYLPSKKKSLKVPNCRILIHR